MDPITFQRIVRDYADGVEGGAYDRDITSARERKFTALLLRTASNDGAANQPYASIVRDTGIREAIISRLTNGQWTANVGFFVEVASPSARTAYGDALERTVTILRSI